MFIDGLLRKQTEKKHSLKKASSDLLVDKIKLIVPFRMSEFVLILRDGSPYKNVSVKEESVFFNNLQSGGREGGPIIVVNRRVEQEMWSWCNFKTARTTYIMDSANFENHDWIYVSENDWDQDRVLLEAWSLRVMIFKYTVWRRSYKLYYGVFESSISIWVYSD